MFKKPMKHNFGTSKKKWIIKLRQRTYVSLMHKHFQHYRLYCKSCSGTRDLSRLHRRFLEITGSKIHARNILFRWVSTFNNSSIPPKEKTLSSISKWTTTACLAQVIPGLVLRACSLSAVLSSSLNSRTKNVDISGSR